MGKKDIKLVMVNLYCVYKTKKLKDNQPSKSDRKDSRVIAGLVRTERYFYSYMIFRVYAQQRKTSSKGLYMQRNRPEQRIVCRS